MDEMQKLINLRNSAQFFYDLQKLRLATNQRSLPPDPKHKNPRPALDEADQAFLGLMTDKLEEIEKTALEYVARRLKGIAIYETWLKHQRGIGPTMAAVLLSSFSIEREEYVSQMWSYAGLSVADGRAVKRVKGEKANYNVWLKGKLLGVLAETLLKAYSLDESGQYVVKRTSKATGETNVSLRASDPGAPFPWRSVYDGRKNYRRSQRVPCACCERSGWVVFPKAEAVDTGKGFSTRGAPKPASSTDEGAETCPNCGGSGIGPWGRSDAHRDLDAKRYMVKMFLIELHKRWRESLGLPVRAPYHEERLGHVHHASP